MTIITNKRVFASEHRLVENGDVLQEPRIVELPVPFGAILYRSTPGKLLFYLYFTLFSFLRILAENPQPILLYSRGPHPFTEIPCVFYRFLRAKVKLASDTTDLWPDAVEYLQMAEFTKQLLINIGNWLNRLVYPKIDFLVTHNDPMAKILEYRFKRQPCIIYGVIDLDKFRPMEKRVTLKMFSAEMQKKLNDKFVVLYAGLLGPFQSPISLLMLAERLLNNPDILIVIVGEGPLKQSLLAEIKSRRLSNVLFLETQPFEMMPLVYNTADVFIHSYAQFDLLTTGLPKKLIEYSATGKPILCISPPCVASELCSRYGSGFQVLPQEIEEAAEIIKCLMLNPALRKEMGMRARCMAEDLFSLSGAAKKIVELIT